MITPSEDNWVPGSSGDREGPFREGRFESVVPTQLHGDVCRRAIGQEIEKKFRKNTMDGAGLLILSGPSGIGKSMTLRHTLIPQISGLSNSLRIELMPNDHEEGFFPSLGAHLPLPQSMDWRCPSVCAAALESLRLTYRGGLFLVIDAFEQIFDGGSDGKAEMDFLWQLIGDGTIHVIATLRSPFLRPCLNLLERYTNRPNDFFVRMAVPGKAMQQALVESELGRALPKEGPSVGKDHGRIANYLVDQLDQAPYAVPFISRFVGRYASEEANDPDTWLQQGGLAKIMVTHAETTLDDLKPRLQKQFNTLAKALVGWDEDCMPVLDDVRYGDLAKLGDDTKTLLDVLIHERLIYLTGDDPDSAAVNFAHPDILFQWPRLKSLLDEERDDRQSRQELDERATAWDRNGRQDEDRWLDNRLLVYAEALLKGTNNGLRPVTRDFLQTFHEEEEPQKNAPKIGPVTLVSLIGLAFLGTSYVVAVSSSSSNGNADPAVAPAAMGTAPSDAETNGVEPVTDSEDTSSLRDDVATPVHLTR